ncbi:spore germination protein GerPE [Bacillus sp. MRMR6]|uniref:spore germination protein GerPE n=1 Tax=Bacillus sp. MRMR6 TaxID=1928617 RepID=UPI0009512A3F|nr:spore germination protein GerPE [Bacillus sp. MRMR6]OLS36493.1 spore gernimation protein [Bacillus sp. MRMR6]
MLQRSSVVNSINIETVSFSSIVQLGDSRIINGFSRALAVQRETEIFFDKEGEFSSFPIFSEAIPLPPITETINFSSRSTKPLIKVNEIAIIGLSSSAVLHVGNSEYVSMEARVKHIRQLLPKNEEQ